MTAWLEGLLFFAWLMGLAIGVVLLARPVVRWSCGSRAVYTLWGIPLATVTAPLFVARPEGPEIYLSQTALAQTQMAAPSGAPSWLGYVFLGWLVGVLAISLWQLLRIQSHRRSLVPLASLGTQDRVEILSSAGITAPMARGIRQRQIILPDAFARLYEPSMQNLILQHEMTHHVRRDPLARAVAECLRCLFWFHPLVHIAMPYFRQDQELACDEYVLRNVDIDTRRAYGKALLDTAGLGVTGPIAWSTHKSALAQRLKQLAIRRSRKPQIIGVTAAATLIATTAILSVLAIPPEQAQFRLAAIDAHNKQTNAELAENVMYAVRTGDEPTLHKLLSQGAPTEFVAHEEGTPLILAAKQGRMEMVRALVAHDANVNAAVMTAGSPLIMAAKHGHAEVAEFLIQHGSDVDAHVFFDETPLINAARFGHQGIAKHLLDAGARVDKSVTTFSITHLPLGTKSALSEARRVGHTQMVQLLTSHQP